MRRVVFALVCYCIHSAACLRTVSTSSKMTAHSTVLAPIISAGRCGFASHVLPKVVTCAQEQEDAPWECFYDRSQTQFYPNVTVVCKDESLLDSCHVVMHCREPSGDLTVYNAWNDFAMGFSFFFALVLLVCIIIDVARCFVDISSWICSPQKTSPPSSVSQESPEPLAPTLHVSPQSQ